MSTSSVIFALNSVFNWWCSLVLHIHGFAKYNEIFNMNCTVWRNQVLSKAFTASMLCRATRCSTVMSMGRQRAWRITVSWESRCCGTQGWWAEQGRWIWTGAGRGKWWCWYGRSWRKCGDGTGWSSRKSGQILLPYCHNPRVWQTDRQNFHH